MKRLPPNRWVPPAPNLSALADKQAARAAASVKTQIRLSRLDTILIDGRPIGDCTVAEVRRWGERRQKDAKDAARDVRFALALAANLPAGAVIREWWTKGEEVDSIYESSAVSDAA